MKKWVARCSCLTLLLLPLLTAPLMVAAEPLETTMPRHSPFEQQPPEVIAIQKATGAVTAGNYASAASLYLPVLKQLAEKKLEATDELIRVLSSLVRTFEDVGRLYEACEVQSAIWGTQKGRPDTATSAAELKSLAELHYKTKNYELAASELEQFLQRDASKNARANNMWLDDLVDIYCVQNRLDKLKDLIPVIARRIEDSKERLPFSGYGQIVTRYMKVGLFQQSRQLYETLIRTGVDRNLDLIYVPRQLSETLLERHMIGEACEMYQFWTDQIGKHSGKNSKEWLDAMNIRLAFTKDYPSYGRLAESEFLQADVHLTDVKERLQILQLFRRLLPERSEEVLKRIDPVLAPESSATAELYAEAASLFTAMQTPERAAICQDRAVACQDRELNSLCDRLPGNLFWLRKYIDKLRTGLAAHKSIVNQVILTSTLENADADPVGVECQVLILLETNNQPESAIELLKLIVANAASSDLHNWNIEALLRTYVSLTQPPTQRTRGHHQSNVDFVGQFYCLLLQAPIEKSFSDIGKLGISGVNFVIQYDQIKNVSCVDPSFELSDASRQSFIKPIQPLVSRLKDPRDLLFKVVCDRKLKSIVLSVKLQSGEWFTPTNFRK